LTGPRTERGRHVRLLKAPLQAPHLRDLERVVHGHRAALGPPPDPQAGRL